MNELGLSCLGCCGTIVGDKDEVDEAIRKNTIEFKHCKDKKGYVWRFKPNNLRACGICPNLVKDDVRKDRVLCPAHPTLNNGEDIREGYCDTLYLCKTAFLFGLWDESMRSRFITFLKDKVQKNKLDWYAYSIMMDNDSLLREFEESGYF